MKENNNHAKKLVGVDVRHSKTIAVCLDEKHQVLESFRTETKSGDETTVHLGNLVVELKERFGDFEKIGLAVPGLLHKPSGRIALSTLIPEHTEVDILTELSKKTPVEIHIDNDANAAAYAEYVLGAGRGNKDMFYVTLGSGVGGALIFGDEIWHGASGFAGEFGYVSINEEGLKLEDVASSPNILRRTRRRFHKDPTSSLNEIGEENITIKDIVREANKEDDFAMLMLQRTGKFVGAALAGVINLLNIEKIVVGGKILEAEEVVLEAITERAKELSFAPSFETVEIVRGKLGENAAAIGAAILSDSDS